MQYKFLIKVIRLAGELLNPSIQQVLDLVDADNPVFCSVCLLQYIQFKILHIIYTVIHTV